MKKRILSALLVVALFLTAFANVSAADRNSLDNFQKQASYTAGQFADVASGAWYEDNVKSAYELSLMVGTSGTAFDPEGQLSIAQAVTIAARLHNVYAGNGETFAPGTPWYQVYMDYAAIHGMLVPADYPDPEALATRAEYAAILSAAFPDEALTPLNTVNAIPDVPADADYASAVLRLYRAGILKGNDESGTFAPDRGINRAEVAAMVTRMADPALRLRFTLPGQETGDTVTVTFDWNYGGKAPQTVEVPIGQPVPEPEQPTRTLFRFDGWFNPMNGFVKYDFSAPVYEDITLYAHWSTVVKDAGKEPEPLPSPEPSEEPTPSPEPSEEPTVFIVSFDSNGGSRLASQQISAGDSAIRPTDPTREGFVFAGWFSDAELTTEYGFDAPVTADIILYAKWNSLAVTITINTGEYADSIVNRTVTGTVASNVAIEQINYTLQSETRLDSGTISLDNTGAFSVDVLLEHGSNTITVTVKTVEGTESSKSETMMYDSGYLYYDDQLESGYTYDDILALEELVFIPVYRDEIADESSCQLVANILNLYFRVDTTMEQREEFVTEMLNGEVVGYLSALDMVQAKVNPISEKDRLTEDECYQILETLVEDHVETYLEAGGILEDIELEFLYPETVEMSVTTNDPWSANPDAPNDANRWWIERIDADDAWEYDDYNGLDYLTNISVGIVDGGFASTHEDLDGQITVISKEDTSDNHGTHVAGIIGATADNGFGLAGVMHNTQNSSNGTLLGYDMNSTGSTSVYQKSLTKLVEAGAKVINFSQGYAHIDLGFNVYETSQSKVDSYGKSASKAMGKLLGKGYDFVVVQSAGNGNKANIGVAYRYNGLFCAINRSNCHTQNAIHFLWWNQDAVSADDIMSRILIASNIRSNDELYVTSSGYGENGETGELNVIAAPGTDIFSTVVRGYKPDTGTSMAAAMVSAAAALSWSVNPDLSGAEVVELIMDNTRGTAATSTGQRPINGVNYPSHATGGMGILNVNASVEAAIQTLPTYQATVVNAVNGQPLESASVKIHRGDANGEIVGSQSPLTTNADGVITLPRLPKDTYTLEIELDGFVPIFYKVYADYTPKSETVNLGTLPMSSVLDENMYRIVLRWGETPRDLDSHLVASTNTGDAFHVYYSQKEPSPGYANLDVDDTTSYGPETITITQFENLRNIRYAVHDYTNRSSTTSTEMSNSQAYVEVYKGTQHLAEFTVTPNTGGTVWEVFRFDASGNVIPTGRMTYCESPVDVLR